VNLVGPAGHLKQFAEHVSLDIRSQFLDGFGFLRRATVGFNLHFHTLAKGELVGRYGR
jgi:hypothetical protein